MQVAIEGVGLFSLMERMQLEILSFSSATQWVGIEKMEPSWKVTVAF